MSGGLKGPLSPPQELEVGCRRPPYLLVNNIWTNISFGLVIFLNYPDRNKNSELHAKLSYP